MTYSDHLVTSDETHPMSTHLATVAWIVARAQVPFLDNVDTEHW